MYFQDWKNVSFSAKTSYFKYQIDLIVFISVKTQFEVEEYSFGQSSLIVAVDKFWLDCVNSGDLEDISYEFYQKKKRSTLFSLLSNDSYSLSF